ncbi:hypothetical protein [Fluviispira multicolorata]|uniref:Uncharacterized protein n=1 Tax=Fluviispira multicolorata TaxID=2654512 RepID=A0A833N189_9BACT|nr:hypothetical protein [Fluviispira multicolorata]KAB8030015.1 hypothetical protein GCL57_10790 [Fluviispira multicolorata]
MKKKKFKKNNIIILIAFIIPTALFFFKDDAYIFLKRFEKAERIINQLNLDEFINKSISKNDKELLEASNRLDEKNIFELFHFSKKGKLRSQEIDSYARTNPRIISILNSDKLINKLTYSYSNDRKSSILLDTIILTNGESINCDCLEALKERNLIFENKGAPPNKTETSNYITITYENKKFDNFEIKNNERLKINIPNAKEGKSITISWKKNSSGVLIFYGIEKKIIPNSQKILFLTTNLSNNDKFLKTLKEKLKPENSFISQESYPTYSNFEQNIRALETNSSPINNGYTYESNDLFRDREKYFYNIINQKSKDLLRINVFSEEKKDSQIQHANILINIRRDRSIYNIKNIITDTIRNSNTEVIRLDLNSLDTNSAGTILDIVDQMKKDISIFIITGHDFDINNNILKSNQNLIISIPNIENQELIEEIKNKLANKKFQQNIVMDILLRIIKEDKKKTTLNLPTSIVIQSKDIDAFIFNNEEYISNNKFKVSIENIKKYQKEIEELRTHNQIKDISFSFINIKSAKIKLFSKDKVLRCFSNKSIKNTSFGYDSKQNYFTVELKMVEEQNIDEWELSCLINSDNFINEYKIESQKDGKPLSPTQIAIGQYVLHPNPNLISNNSIILNNINDFSLLKAKSSPRLVDKAYNEDLMIWSNDYPTLSPTLKYSVTYEEKQ